MKKLTRLTLKLPSYYHYKKRNALKKKLKKYIKYLSMGSTLYD